MAYNNRFYNVLHEMLIEIRLGNPKRVLTVEEAARYLGVSMSTLYKWTSQRIIPHSKVPNGNIIFFDKKTITTWALSNKIPTREQLTGKVSRPLKSK